VAKTKVTCRVHNPQSKEENIMSSTAKLSQVDSAKKPEVIYYKDATELASLIRTKQLCVEGTFSPLTT
jgi:hypothetical protein